MPPDDNDRLRDGTLSPDPEEGLVPIATGTAGNREEPPGNRPEPPEKARGSETLAEFYERADSLPPIAWLIEGLVQDRRKHMVVASPNAGKTWFAFIIAKTAVTQGRPVLLILQEGDAHATAKRLRVLGFEKDAPVRVMHELGVKLGDGVFWPEVHRFVLEHDAPVVIVDTFSDSFDGNENDTEAVKRAKAPLDRLMSANPRTLIVLLHHTSKAGSQMVGPDSINASRGSSVLNGWADVQSHLTHVPVRKGSDTVAFDVANPKVRDGEKGCRERFTVDLVSGEVSREDVTASRDTELTERVLEVLRQGGKPLSTEDVIKAVGAQRKAVLATLSQLTDSGDITRRKRGRGFIFEPAPPLE